MTTPHFLCSLSGLEPGTSRTVRVGSGEELAVHRTEDGDVFATADSCTHEQWSLGEDSDLERHEVVCPLHLARFDLRTGAALCFPATVALKTYLVFLDGDSVMIGMNDDSTALTQVSADGMPR